MQKLIYRDFPGGPMVKNLPSNAGDMDLISVQHMPVLWLSESGEKEGITLAFGFLSGK